MSGCQNYDCYGAGQRTCSSFPGESWRDGPEQARAFFETFFRMRLLHELRWLLHEAGRLELEPVHAAERASLLADLERDAGPSPQDAAALDLDALERRVRRFLRELRRYFPAPPPRRHLPVLERP